MLAEASKTPATAALSSISTATALGSLPQITKGRGEETHRGRREVREERLEKMLDKGRTELTCPPSALPLHLGLYLGPLEGNEEEERHTGRH